jgi:hypothetical protein
MRYLFLPLIFNLLRERQSKKQQAEEQAANPNPAALSSTNYETTCDNTSKMSSTRMVSNRYVLEYKYINYYCLLLALMGPSLKIQQLHFRKL